MGILQESRAERAANAIQFLDRQLRSQLNEFYYRDQENEASRRERALLHAELQSREKPHRDPRIKPSQEVEELKEVRCFEAEETQELRADAFSRHEESLPGKELRESQSTVNQLQSKFRNCKIGWSFWKG